MTPSSASVRRWLLPMLSWVLLVVCQLAFGNAYDAQLPAQLHSSPKMCDYAPCREVFPGATSFSERKGSPPYVEAYADNKGKPQLLGYVMLSTDITDTPAYSGKPVVTLIGLDKSGHFVGTKVLKHSEPILLLGIPEGALTKFLAQYLGKHVGDDIQVGAASDEEGHVGLDAISGATVTVISENQVMMASAQAVARQVGILEPTVRDAPKYQDLKRSLDWASLVADGSVRQLVVSPQAVGLPSATTPFIELWFGCLNQPDIGRAILGENGHRSLMGRLHADETALFVIRSGGQESFKGSGFVRGGIYDRVQVRQGSDAFTLLLVMVAVVYGLRDKLTRRSTHHNKWPVNGFKYVAWVISIGAVGFGLLAQPSITQVLTWFHSLLFHWTWELFLSDPFIFIFWIFIIVTVFVWGRGLFCGWLCPFGSMSELIYKLAEKLGMKRWQGHLPMHWHNRLKWVKYGVFFGLLTVSMFSMSLAEQLAEVEPFKTTFLVGMFNRSSQRGNGIQLYNAQHARIVGNQISFVRDAIYVDVSHDAVFLNNRLHHSRYGTHYMNSYRNLWEGNDSWMNRGGLALMEVRDQVVRNNRAWANSDHGIMLRTLQDSVVENNIVAGNVQGFFIYDAEFNTLRNNLVVDNLIGVRLWAGSKNNKVEGNDFIANRDQVRYVGARNQPWGDKLGNFWSNYLGWDRDGDGRGDVPYEANDLVDRLSWRYPTVQLLLASPAIATLRLVGRQFPILRAPSVVDAHPRMQPTHPDWRDWLGKIHPGSR